MSTKTGKPEGEVKDEVNLKPVETTVDTEDKTFSTTVVPEKYKGKSVEDIVKMHEEAEKLLGRQGLELGELRRTVDDFVKVQLESLKPKQQPDEELDFFKEPEKTITKIVEQHPAVLEARKAAAQAKAHQSVQTLAAKHPDYEQVVTSPEFQNWVGASRVRVELFKRADQNYDIESADELLTTFKLLKAKQEDKNLEEGAKGMTEAIKDSASSALKKAAVTSGGSADTVRAVNQKPVYRRADIIELIRFHPDRYAALQDEIMAAYREKRVI